MSDLFYEGEEKQYDRLDPLDRADMIYISGVCSRCKHYDRSNRLARKCEAFPHGIPTEIWIGKNDHTKPYEGDHGITFEQVEKPDADLLPPIRKGPAPTRFADRSVKNRVYVTPTHRAPKGAPLYRGPHGGVYYIQNARGEAEEQEGNPERESPTEQQERPQNDTPEDRPRPQTPEDEHRELTDEEYKNVLAEVRRRAPGEGMEIRFKNWAEVHTILKKSSFGLISAGPNLKNEKHRAFTPEEIKARHEALRKDLVDMGYCFTEVLGKYGEREDSFLVMAHDAERDDMIALGERYEQETVIYCDHGKNEYIWTSDSVSDDGTPIQRGSIMPGEGYDEIGNEEEDVYTEVYLEDGGKTRFMLHFEWGTIIPPEE